MLIQVGKYPEAMQLDAKRTRLNLYLLLSAECGSIIHTVLVLQVYRKKNERVIEVNTKHSESQ